jgi:hypothetical protein
MVMSICGDTSETPYLQAALLSFNFQAVSAGPQAGSFRELIHVSVFPPLVMFRCKILLLEILDPEGHMFF